MISLKEMIASLGHGDILVGAWVVIAIASLIFGDHENNPDA